MFSSVRPSDFDVSADFIFDIDDIRRTANTVRRPPSAREQ